MNKLLDDSVSCDPYKITGTNLKSLQEELRESGRGFEGELKCVFGGGEGLSQVSVGFCWFENPSQAALICI